MGIGQGGAFSPALSRVKIEVKRCNEQQHPEEALHLSVMLIVAARCGNHIVSRNARRARF